MGKRVISVVSALFLMAGFSAESTAESDKVKVIVAVTGMRNADGLIGALLYTSETGFPDEKAKAYKITGTKHDGKKAWLVFNGVPRGSFAISVIHDENENRLMDKKMGIFPAEGFGFSRNPRVISGPPDFTEAEIQASEPEVVVPVRLNYM